jgi:hypothetical protein
MKYLIPFHDFLNESKVEDIYTKYYADIESETFTQIISADPTSIVKNGEVVKMGSYSKWLLQLYKAKNLKLEDLDKATDYLATFDALKKRNRLSGREADILSFKSLPELFQTISEVGGTGKPTEDESYLIEDRYFINNKEAEIEYEDDDYLIVIPRTLEASQFYGRDTEWCTLYPDNFERYSEDGTLYIIIDKRKLNTSDRKRRLQFHFEESQYMDKTLDTEEKSKYIPYFLGVLGAEFHLKYDYFDQFSQGGVAIVELDGMVGCIDEDGKVIVPLKYDAIDYFDYGYANVVLNGKSGLVDEDGKEVIPTKYDSVRGFREGMARVVLNGKCGFVDKHGNEVIPLKYDAVRDFNEGRAWVKLNGKEGRLELNGKEYWY